MLIEKQHIVQWLAHCAKNLQQEQEFLTDLDRDIGDADHGAHLNRGFTIIAQNLPKVERQNIATILKNVGVTLLYNVGGASGPLYSTLFLRTAEAIGTREQLSFEELIDSLKQGVDGVILRGKAKAGEKTMCDVWIPTIETAKLSIASGADIHSLLDELVTTAEKSAVATIEMQASKGIARHLGQQSIGHQDPGATSSAIIIKALVQALKGN
ncbi:PTS-dependent dihydroxyacetone kinase ADP-binding subunit DhaL [Vibrio halioticoli NBRC 102217]|uniref:PTS-dependent dihydroxyacetone kinase ADP-binding subunit DhaL n=1 Tax=Vibrio halioticoli NBRC 102217 TaxID=1219072 RepID=V5FG05_9VIBR|nr:dihydroxyacetone kinase subunit DhaL [Vibrio halioticoli]GAD87982.1 PTS-dependent dihydroxyacetone kinase ADP-binding subunit DhaL [Vibrio halioticoli NBRC 102217]